MKEGISQRIKEVEGHANARSMVLAATLKVLERIEKRYPIGKGATLMANEAAARDLEEYETPPGAAEEIADLKNIAQDAAEGILRELGHDDPAMIADFNKLLDEELLLPDEK